MGKISKTFALMLILVMAVSSVSLMVIKPAYAQSVPTPSVPSFTLKFIHTHYFNQTQQYDNNTVTVSIKNQPYAVSINGNTYQIFYDIRIKVHSAQDWQWTELYPTGTYYQKEFTSYLKDHLASITNNTPIQSSSEYTVAPLTYYEPPLDGEGISFPLSLNTTLDFQVKADVGHSTQGWVADNLQSPVLGGHFMTVTALDTSSNWSGTQTLTLPATTSTSASTSPTPTQTISELSWLVILPLLLSVFSVAVVVRHRKTANKGGKRL